MVKLQLTRNYINRHTSYVAGQVIEVSEAAAQYLMSDSPGTFEVYKPRKRRARKNRAVTETEEK